MRIFVPFKIETTEKGGRIHTKDWAPMGDHIWVDGTAYLISELPQMTRQPWTFPGADQTPLKQTHRSDTSHEGEVSNQGGLSHPGGPSHLNLSGPSHPHPHQGVPHQQGSTSQPGSSGPAQAGDPAREGVHNVGSHTAGTNTVGSHSAAAPHRASAPPHPVQQSQGSERQGSAFRQGVRRVTASVKKRIPRRNDGSRE